MNNSDEYIYKYLKYKQKYINLKLEGGGNPSSLRTIYLWTHIFGI